ncbi:hypothetical protein BD626DRAFT_521056 [Schizophyllum amplum]|uniref:Uncharacterized protein n=1 Tax=Schizophyllum amplum TaxID=97359 RepID=A0A550BTV0_9AGAR|nr:hypothetical protein BD626DRAFT_521056 [Auriculariopsis ampla]
MDASSLGTGPTTKGRGREDFESRDALFQCKKMRSRACRTPPHASTSGNLCELLLCRHPHPALTIRFNSGISPSPLAFESATVTPHWAQLSRSYGGHGFCSLEESMLLGALCTHNSLTTYALYTGPNLRSLAFSMLRLLNLLSQPPHTWSAARGLDYSLLSGVSVGYAFFRPEVYAIPFDYPINRSGSN